MQRVIHTIKSSNESRSKEKGSSFIAKCAPIQTFEKAKEFLGSIKKEYYDATHHCFAVKLHDGEVQFSDDGEPSGAAGIRILNAIDHYNLTDLIVVVIRYFGGTKLGVGPLGKAYFNSAFSALEKAERIHLMEYFSSKIILPPNYLGDVFHQLEKNNAVIMNQEYEENLIINCLIESAKYLALVELLKNLSGGKIFISKEEQPVFK